MGNRRSFLAGALSALGVGAQANAAATTPSSTGKQKVEISNSMDGFVRRDEGGVVVIALLQQQGYVYLRP